MTSLHRKAPVPTATGGKRLLLLRSKPKKTREDYKTMYVCAETGDLCGGNAARRRLWPITHRIMRSKVFLDQTSCDVQGPVSVSSISPLLLLTDTTRVSSCCYLDVNTFTTGRSLEKADPAESVGVFFFFFFFTPRLLRYKERLTCQHE